MVCLELLTKQSEGETIEEIKTTLLAALNLDLVLYLSEELSK